MPKSNKESHMKKSTFLKNLTVMDKDQIYNLILQKGKEPKLVKPIVYNQ